MTSSLKRTKIEFHILQSFPVTCLNRDDVGAPKTAKVGGTTRARVSSQSWKRAIRQKMHQLIEDASEFESMSMGKRTKYMVKMLQEALIEKGADEATAENCALAFSKECFKKVKKNEEKGYTTDTLMFISKNECREIAQAFQALEFDEKKANDILKTAKDCFKPEVDGLDIALFGRMVAGATNLNVEAACSVAHAISTHKISNEIDFFTAVDDNPVDQGSSHIGTLEYNSATYYRYISLDLGQLDKALHGVDVEKAISLFTKALFLAVPEARQTTQAGYCPWDYAKILIRKGQNIQLSFDKDVKYGGQGYSEPSKAILKEKVEQNEKSFGSLYHQLGSFDYGDDAQSIDDICAFINSKINELKS